jgi:hypothetical protein
VASGGTGEGGGGQHTVSQEDGNVNGNNGRNSGGSLPIRAGGCFEAWLRGDHITLRLRGVAELVVLDAGGAIRCGNVLASNVVLQVEGDDPPDRDISLLILCGKNCPVSPKHAAELAGVLVELACQSLAGRADALRPCGKGARQEEEEEARWTVAGVPVGVEAVPFPYGGDGTAGGVGDPEDEDDSWVDLGGEGRSECGRR